jgi:hypothetical protein
MLPANTGKGIPVATCSSLIWRASMSPPVGGVATVAAVVTVVELAFGSATVVSVDSVVLVAEVVVVVGPATVCGAKGFSTRSRKLTIPTSATTMTSIRGRLGPRHRDPVLPPASGR